MIIGIDSRPKKPSENDVAQRFSTCLGEQREEKKLKTKMHMNHLEMRHSMAMTFESKTHQHLSGCFVLQVFPQHVSHKLLGKQFPKALSQWSHLESCHAIILEEFQDAALTET